VGHKKRSTLLLSIPSLIIDRFLKFFHWRTLQTICNNAIIIYATTTLPCEICKQKLMIITKI